jgi:hypothetical protein
MKQPSTKNQDKISTYHNDIVYVQQLNKEFTRNLSPRWGAKALMQKKNK